MIKELLTEAVKSNADQLVMISRSDISHLYFLTRGRVKRVIQFEKDITRAFIEAFSNTESRIPWSDESGKRFSIECHVAPNEIGDCLSVTINEESNSE